MKNIKSSQYENNAENFASPPHFKLKILNFFLLQYVMITDQKQTCHHGHNQHIHLGHLKMGELRSQTCSLSFFSWGDSQYSHQGQSHQANRACWKENIWLVKYLPHYALTAGYLQISGLAARPKVTFGATAMRHQKDPFYVYSVTVGSI